MGLDNGIILKFTDEEKQEVSTIPFFERISERYIQNNEIEVVYWRKCWGIRDKIVAALHMDQTEYNKTLDLEDINAIIRICREYCKESVWNEDNNSIWEFDEYIEQHLDNIFCLMWLYQYKKKHPNAICYFYDSY